MRLRFLLAALVATPAAAQAPSRGELLQRLDSIVAAEMARHQNVGVSVGIARGGDVFLARGYGHAQLEHGVPARAETVYRIGSLTKQFTAAAIMQLVEQGRLGLDDEVTRFLPDYPVQGRRITIHHLLTHTSGIRSYTGLGPRFWNEASRLDLDHAGMLALFQHEPLDFEPGAQYRYNNSGYYLLGMIIERVSGQPYAEYLAQRLLAPLGLRSTSYCDERRVIPHRAQGYEVVNGAIVNDGAISMNTPGAAGAMCSTVLDLLAWQRAFNEARPVGPAARDRMRTAHVAASDSTGYGYGLGVGRLDGRILVSHSGGINGFNAYLAHLPDPDLTVVVLTNNGGGRAPQLGQLLLRALLHGPAGR